MALLSAFNPHEFSAATVRTIATGRGENLQAILATIRANLAGETMQHLIVSAPRGYGKSFMMRHVQIEVEAIAADENLALAVALMPEEMPHVKEPETLIREFSRALTGGAAAEAELTWHEDEGAAWEGAVETLGAAIGQRVGTRGLFVVLIENFDALLRRAFPKEVQASRLRALLTAPNSRMMVIAASASGAFDRDYDSRLFVAFREIVLEPWSVAECLAFFDRQRRDAGKPPLEDFARARARAVALFIGGTPRLATLLGDALFDDDVLRAADLLQRLVDELTPYYKERIEALPGRSQKLLDALLRGGEPATQSELARRVNAHSQAAIAGPFNDLVLERVVIGEKAAGSAQILYRVADRVFAHYYRRRVVHHGQAACPLEALVDLLAEFFSPDEKRTKATEFARSGRMAEARLMARLHDADLGLAKGMRWWILYDLGQNYIPRQLLPLASGATADALRAIAALAASGMVDQAYARIETAFAAADDMDSRVLLLLARSRLDAYEGIEGGLPAAEEAIAWCEKLAGKPVETVAKLGRAWSLGVLGWLSKSLELSLQLAERAKLCGPNRDEAVALTYVAYNLSDLGRHEEAVTAARAAASLANKAGDVHGRAEALRQAASSLGALGRHEEGVTAAREAASLANKAGDVRQEAAAQRYAAFSLGALGRHEEALAAARAAAGLANKIGDVRGEAAALRYAAFNLGQLGRHEEAVTAAREAASLANKASDVHVEAEALRELALNLGDLGQYPAAIGTFGAAAAILDKHPQEEIEILLNQSVAWVAAQAADTVAGGAAGLEPLHALLRPAAEHLNVDGLRRSYLQSWLQALANAAIRRIDDPDRLEAWATAIDLHFPARFGDETSRLRAAARFHRSGRDPATLAPLDPDFAKTLAAMFPPANPAPPPPKRARKGAAKRKGNARK